MNQPSSHDPRHDPQISPQVYKRRWYILAVACLSLFVTMLANMALNMALPSLAKELSLDNTQITWIVDIYSLLFAALLFTMGSIGDKFGRKRILMSGLAIFSLAGIYAATLATSGMQLIAARAVMGIAGAMVMPATLSIITNTFPHNERAKAIAIWSAVAGAGASLGSIITGTLLEFFSWHSAFYFGAFIAIVGIVAGLKLIPESRDPEQPAIDWWGGLLSTAGLLALVYGIIEAPAHGWDSPATIATIGLGLVILAAFVIWELRHKDPMLDVRLFKIPAFGISSLALTLTFFALMGIFFSASQLFQLVLGYGTLQSSLAMLPAIAFVIVSAPLSPRLVSKIGTRWTVGLGMALVSVGIFIVSTVSSTDPSYLHIISGMAVMMAGMGLAMTPTTNLLMSAVPIYKAGMGSATNDTTRELGGALGVAVLGSIIAAVYKDQIAATVTNLPAQASEIAKESLPAALVIAEQMGPAGQALAAAAKVAWMDALSSAMLIGAIICLIAAIIAVIGLPKGDTEEVEAVADAILEAE